jgi:hypothetical protein
VWIVASMGCGRRRVMGCVVESGGGLVTTADTHSHSHLSITLIFGVVSLNKLAISPGVCHRKKTEPSAPSCLWSDEEALRHKSAHLTCEGLPSPTSQFIPSAPGDVLMFIMHMKHRIVPFCHVLTPLTIHRYSRGASPERAKLHNPYMRGEYS